jgi:hypothetical protein
VVTKLDRLARPLPDAREILEDLTRREVKLSIGGSVHDSTDPVGRLLLNALPMVAEFESDLIRLRTKEGMRVAKAKGRLRGGSPSSIRARKRTSSRCTAPASTAPPSSGTYSASDAPPVYRAIERDSRRRQQGVAIGSQNARVPSRWPRPR